MRNGPVARLERGVALEQLERENRARQERELATVAEERIRYGVSVLTPDGVGTTRYSSGVSEIAVSTMKMSSPMIGRSPLSTF